MRRPKRKPATGQVIVLFFATSSGAHPWLLLANPIIFKRRKNYSLGLSMGHIRGSPHKDCLVIE